MAVIHTVKTRDGGTVAVELTRGKAIKAYCTECMGYEGHPKDCPSIYCKLFPFRGKTRLAYDGADGKRRQLTGLE